MNKHSRRIVDALIAGNNKQADKLFELAMAKTIKEQMTDYKSVVAQKMFEAAENVGGDFIPNKQDYTIEAIDPNGSPEHLPNGMPVKYKVNAWGPSKAYRDAAEKGHKSIKVIDSTGQDVTAHGEQQYKYGDRDPINESLRLVSKHGDGQHTAKVYKDNEWEEYRVKYFKDGKHVGEKADYHTDDLDDAKNTADGQIKRYGKVDESVDVDAAFDSWKKDVADKHPQHAAKLRYVSKPDAPNQISAEVAGKDQSFGVFDHKTSKGQVLEEDTAVGNIDAKLTAQRQEQEQVDAQARQQKAPTIKDVVSILGNTVSVADTSAVN